MNFQDKLAGHRFILIGALPPPATGPSVSFEMLCKNLQKYGANCVIVNLSKNNYADKMWSNCFRGISILGRLFPYLFALIRGYRDVYINIAQSLRGFCRDAFLIWAARAFGARIVIHLRGGNYGNFYHEQSKLVRFLIRVTLRQTKRILVLGEGLRAMYSFDPAIVDRIHVVYNGLSVDTGGQPKTIEASNNATVHILYLSNLIESKGYFHVLESIRILRDVHKITIHCIFAGLFIQSRDDVNVRGIEHAKAMFFEYIEKHKLHNQVKYVGAVYDRQKWALLRRSHFFVLPTRYMNEGQPVSIIEAMAYGCVVISTEYRAIPDLVINGTTGVFVDFGKPEQIASSIADLCRDPIRYEEMSKSAVKRYETYFTSQAYFDAMTVQLTEIEV